MSVVAYVAHLSQNTLDEKDFFEFLKHVPALEET